LIVSQVVDGPKQVGPKMSKGQGQWTNLTFPLPVFPLPTPFTEDAIITSRTQVTMPRGIDWPRPALQPFLQLRHA